MKLYSFAPFKGGDTLSEYICRYRRSDLPNLEVGAPLDLCPSLPPPVGFTPQLTWEDPWPFGDRAGVYLIYAGSFELLYIGKASMGRCLGQRLYDYFRAGECCVLQHDFWPQPPRFVINIAVPQAMPFEAAALEEYLIAGLQPICNINGKLRQTE